MASNNWEEPGTVAVECWVVIDGKPGTYSGTYTEGPYKGQTRIEKVTIKRITQNKPTLTETEVAMKMKVDVHATQFLDGIATIRATIPETDEADDIQATVDMPVRGRPKSPAASVIKP